MTEEVQTRLAATVLLARDSDDGVEEMWPARYTALSARRVATSA